MLPWLHAVRVHLYDEQDEEVSVGHPQELLEEVEGEERNDVVLWRRHHVVLQTQKQQPMATVNNSNDNTTGKSGHCLYSH